MPGYSEAVNPPVAERCSEADDACGCQAGPLAAVYPERRGLFTMTDQHVSRAAAAVAALVLIAAAARAAPDVSAEVAAAINDPARPESDRQRDANRKPADTLTFAGIKRGDKVAELIPGGGYFTRLLSDVVGEKGHVYAVAPPRRADAPADAPDPAARLNPITGDPRYRNVNVLVERVTALSVPELVDVVWTSENYHDIHNIAGVDLHAVNRAVFDALKPGGVYVVLDHSAAAGSGVRDTSTLHRIDAEAVKAEVLAAGFVLDAQSELLANPGDPRTLPVFDPSIRGRTDQFIFRFRKPAAPR
jgi:predicted methyltransferase